MSRNAWASMDGLPITNGILPIATLTESKEQSYGGKMLNIIVFALLSLKNDQMERNA